MASVLDGVDQRTRLAGENRLELLLFHLGSSQVFGINVFKVQEVIQCPKLNKMPNANAFMHGLAYLRGRTIPVLDLGLAIGKGAIKKPDESFVIVSEYNQTIQGFLVDSVDRIVNIKWEDIKAPPKGLGKDNYMTAVTRIDDKLVEIIDVEKILAELVGIMNDAPSDELIEAGMQQKHRIFVVDDSGVARNQVKRTLEAIGMDCILAKNGKEAITMLKEMVASANGEQIDLDLVISDIEMPEMDGYTLTREIRANDNLKHLPIILHSSLSGQFNKNMVEQVGADRFLPKFSAQKLAMDVEDILGIKAAS